MEKKTEFVVTDRRKFTPEGEPRPDAPIEPREEIARPVEAAAQAPVAQTAAKKDPPPAAPKEPLAAVPAAETGYNGEQERTAFGGQKMEFIHLLDMLVQTAMMYAGALDTGAERRVDIVGVRQMIDLISVLEEKTKGNLTEQEKDILTNTVFQLRMTYMEIVNMIEKQAIKSAPGAPGTKIK
jgi:hypothetical protein